MRWASIIGLAGCLSACGQASNFSESSSEEVAMEMATTDAAAPAPPSTTTTTATRITPPPPPAPTSTRPQPEALPPGVAPMLAYSYEFAIEAPASGLQNLIRRHEQACLSAGPAVCQVVGSSTRRSGRNELAAELQFRASAAYVRAFRAGLAGEVEGARGEITSSGVSTEDLTRSIVDTEARVRALTLLQTRLEALIASRPGNLEQLLEIERELARVSGEIDAARSNLAVMRARVDTQLVTVSYGSEGAVVDPGDSRPLAEAGDSFARNLAASSAAILTFISIVLPWALVLGLAGWILAVVARRQRLKNPPRSAPPKDPEGDQPPPVSRSSAAL